MSIHDRAAQFSAFAAVTGHEDAIKETGRLTDTMIELNEDRKEILNRKLQWISEHIKEQPKVTITYFQPDKKKEGGSYVETTGIVKKIDEYEKSISMSNGNIILLNLIYEIDYTI